ncbi:tyrosine-type recombinase/integrase [Pedobacter suwonensis]|uniref:tyrosine-type recombinase/integrase n=1 Tax=Pedobacter suwonensis TaxID=332999 RepID=UPI00369B876C
MTDERFNFIKTTINTLPIPSKGKRIYYRDGQVKGLALVVLSSGTKSFYLTKKIEGKTEKIYLGQFPDLSVENARNQPRIKLGKIAIGINPNKETGIIRNEMTFGELFDQYLSRYSKVHKKTWKQDEVEVPRFLGHLFLNKLSHIKREEIQKIHETIYLNNGLYQANRILIRTRAIYNKAIEWGWQGMNPTARLKKYKEKSRERFVQPYELPHLLRAMSEENNKTASDVPGLEVVVDIKSVAHNILMIYCSMFLSYSK